MSNNKLISKILNEVSLDPKVKNGVFNIEENDHMEALREYLLKKGIDEESVKSFSNTILEKKGKYPERQAYNVNGILVTFPTPEYKKEAIKRGTHFEEDPTRKASNIFTEPHPSPTTPPPKDKKPEPKQQSTTEPKTNLPVSQASSSGLDTTTIDKEPVQAKTTAAPQQTPVSTEEPTKKEPTELSPPPDKSEKEKEADKQAIKTMLKGDDYMLEEMVSWFIYNAPEYLMEKIEEHKKKRL